MAAKGKPKDGRKFKGGKGTGGKPVKDRRGGRRDNAPWGGIPKTIGMG